MKSSNEIKEIDKYKYKKLYLGIIITLAIAIIFFAVNSLNFKDISAKANEVNGNYKEELSKQCCRYLIYKDEEFSNPDASQKYLYKVRVNDKEFETSDLGDVKELIKDVTPPDIISKVDCNNNKISWDMCQDHGTGYKIIIEGEGENGDLVYFNGNEIDKISDMDGYYYSISNSPKTATQGDKYISNTSINVTSLDDGIYYLNIVSKDKSGNLSKNASIKFQINRFQLFLEKIDGYWSNGSENHQCDMIYRIDLKKKRVVCLDVVGESSKWSIIGCEKENSDNSVLIKLDFGCMNIPVGIQYENLHITMLDDNKMTMESRGVIDGQETSFPFIDTLHKKSREQAVEEFQQSSKKYSSCSSIGDNKEIEAFFE